MKAYKDICKGCGEEKWISNARGLCDNCVYCANHNGKSKLEVLREKRVTKKPKAYKLKQPPLRSKKTIRKTKERKQARQEVLDKDKETYLKVFNNKPNKCEECDTLLPDVFLDDNENIMYISQYSHILGKGAFPEYRHRFWNFNRLCFGCHQIWDFGDKESMKIYENNKQIILKNTGLEIL